MAHKSHITLFTYNYYLLCEYFITIARLLCSFVRMLCSNTSPKFLKMLLLLHALLILFFGHVQLRGYSRETGGPIFQGAMCKYAYAHTQLVLRNLLFYRIQRVKQPG